VDIKQYIESGILEQFVLGNLSAQQNEEVLRFAAEYPEIQSELDEIEFVLYNYSLANAVEPPSHLKDQIFSNLQKDVFIDSETVKTDNTPTIPFTPPLIDTKARKSNTSFLIAASLVLLCLSTFINLWLYRKWQNTEGQLVSLNAAKQLLTENLKTQEARYSMMQSEMEFMQDPHTRPVVLKGLELMPEALATIYWNSQNSEVYINARILPETKANEQYQLWAIVDGKPVDAGVFETHEVLEEMVKMKSIANATAFAVTIEKKGGSPTPTMEKMVLMGTAS